MAHPTYKLPDDPHAQHRYEVAKAHAAAAKKAGKSSAEIHEIFKKVMDHKPGDPLPTDEAHKKYRSAVLHARKAVEKGKSSQEAHDVYRRIMSGEAKKHQ